MDGKCNWTPSSRRPCTSIVARWQFTRSKRCISLTSWHSTSFQRKQSFARILQVHFYLSFSMLTPTLKPFFPSWLMLFIYCFASFNTRPFRWFMVGTLLNFFSLPPLIMCGFLTFFFFAHNSFHSSAIHGFLSLCTVIISLYFFSATILLSYFEKKIPGLNRHKFI